LAFRIQEDLKAANATDAVVQSLAAGDPARPLFGQMTPTQITSLNGAGTTGTTLLDRIGVTPATQRTIYSTANVPFPPDVSGDAAAAAADHVGPFEYSEGEDDASGGFWTDPAYVQKRSVAPAGEYAVADGILANRGANQPTNQPATERSQKKRRTGLEDRTNGAVQIPRSGPGVAAPWSAADHAANLAAQRQPAAVPAAAPSPAPTAFTEEQRNRAASSFKKYTKYATKWDAHAVRDTTFSKTLKRTGLAMLLGDPDKALVDLLLMTCTAAGEPSLTELEMVAIACNVPVPDGLCDDDSEDVLGLG
jgi:hypothetical protein